MTSTRKLQGRSAVGFAIAALMLLAASPALASEVVGTLSSSPAPSSTITGTVSGGTGSTATGTITGGTGSTISGTVVSGDTGGGGNSSGGGGSRRNSNSNNNGEVLGASTDPSGVGGGFGFPDDAPGAPNAGVGPSSLLYVALLALASLVAAAGTYATRRYAR